MHRMLDLPPELKCQILQILLAEDQLDACFTLFEHPELAELLRCNFAPLFKLVKQHRPVAGQLQQILTTTAHLSATQIRSSRHLALLLETDHFGEIYAKGFKSASQAVSFIDSYRTQLQDADTILVQFAKMTRGNTVMWKRLPDLLPQCGPDSLSAVEHHRILRAILRLQLYAEIRAQYGASRKLKREIHLLFSSWTSWEFDEVRSIAEWIIVEHADLPDHYAQGIHSLFATVASHFEDDITPYIYTQLTPLRNRNRRALFAKRSRKWSDTPSSPQEGRADKRNRDWKPYGHHRGRFVEFTQKLYREYYLADGYPFWSRYSKPDVWWSLRHEEYDIKKRFGECYADVD